MNLMSNLITKHNFVTSHKFINISIVLHRIIGPLSTRYFHGNFHLAKTVWNQTSSIVNKRQYIIKIRKKTNQVVSYASSFIEETLCSFVVQVVSGHPMPLSQTCKTHWLLPIWKHKQWTKYHDNHNSEHEHYFSFETESWLSW